VWIEKELLPWVPAFAEFMLLPRGVRVILDYDDAVFHRYDMHASVAVRAVLGQKLDKLMARADLVLAGNGYLAERARQAGAKRVAIVPTVVDLERYCPTSHELEGPVTVGWIGSPNTAPYLDQVKPVVNALAAGGRIRAVAIGARQDQVDGSAFEAVSWTEESEVDHLARCDIGIMPLTDTPWERGKCGYKLIQYMALALPVVASPVGVNTTLVGPDSGFLARDEKEWRAALLSLASDAGKRRMQGAAGREKVAKEYSLQVWAGRLSGLLRGE
jgi:glycosyltransferase involved in cell wall biosynthesis